jgi:hypothetical protein
LPRVSKEEAIQLTDVYILTSRVEDGHVGRQGRLALDADEERGAAARGHYLARKVDRLEAQRERPLLKIHGFAVVVVATFIVVVAIIVMMLWLMMLLLLLLQTVFYNISSPLRAGFVRRYQFQCSP